MGKVSSIPKRKQQTHFKILQKLKGSQHEKTHTKERQLLSLGGGQQICHTNKRSFVRLPSRLNFLFCCFVGLLLCPFSYGRVTYPLFKENSSTKKTPFSNTYYFRQNFCNQQQQKTLRLLAFLLYKNRDNFNKYSGERRGKKNPVLFLHQAKAKTASFEKCNPFSSFQTYRHKGGNIEVKDDDAGNINHGNSNNSKKFDDERLSNTDVHSISVGKIEVENNSPLVPCLIALTVSLLTVLWLVPIEPAHATTSVENIIDFNAILSKTGDLIDVQERNINLFLQNNMNIIDKNREVNLNQVDIKQTLYSFSYISLNTISSSTLTPSSSSPVFEFILWKSFIAGSMAGVSRALSRIITFPLDTIKTRQQATVLLSKKEEKQRDSLLLVETQAREQNGKIKTFAYNEASSETTTTKEKKSQYLTTVKSLDKLFDGLAPMLLVAGPANAAFFVVYDYLLATTKWLLLNYSNSSSFSFNKGSINIDNLNEIPSIFFYTFFLPFLHICAQSKSSSISPSTSTSAIGSSYVGLVASLLASLPSNMIRIPAEVTKQRVQTGLHSNFFQAGRSILSSEGWKGLYRGGKSQLLRELPFNAVQFVIFNQLKTFFLFHINEYSTFHEILESILHAPANETSAGLIATTVKLPLIVKAFCGASAASVAALLTQPLDTIKTFMMLTTKTENEETIQNTNKQEDSSKSYESKDAKDKIDWTKTIAKASGEDPMSIWETAKYITTNHGFQSLYLGTLPRVGLCFIGGGTFFLAEETTKELLEGLKDLYA